MKSLQYLVQTTAKEIFVHGSWISLNCWGKKTFSNIYWILKRVHADETVFELCTEKSNVLIPKLRKKQEQPQQKYVKETAKVVQRTIKAAETGYGEAKNFMKEYEKSRKGHRTKAANINHKKKDWLLWTITSAAVVITVAMWDINYVVGIFCYTNCVKQ